MSGRKVCSVYHVLRKCTRGDRAVYLHRAGPGAIGHKRCSKGYDRGPNGIIVGNNLERSWTPRRFPSYRAIWPTSPPRPIALSHRITYAELPWRCSCSVIRDAPRGLFPIIYVLSNKASFGIQSCDGFISILWLPPQKIGPSVWGLIKNEVWCCHFDKGSLQVIDRCEGPQIYNMSFETDIPSWRQGLKV